MIKFCCSSFIVLVLWGILQRKFSGWTQLAAANTMNLNIPVVAVLLCLIKLIQSHSGDEMDIVFRERWVGQLWSGKSQFNLPHNPEHTQIGLEYGTKRVTVGAVRNWYSTWTGRAKRTFTSWLGGIIITATMMARSTTDCSRWTKSR